MIIFRHLLFIPLYTGVFAFKWNNHYNFTTVEALIFQQCRENHETLIIYDDSRQLTLTHLQQLHEQFHSVILYKKKHRHQHEFFNVKKVNAILITISTLKKLKSITSFLHNRIWWNVMIPIYILNLPGNNCKLAMDILQHMWEFNILTSYYLCKENNELQIYTYNPFTNRAPSNWTEVQRSPTESRWTLYRQKYQTGTKCQDLDFDRTKYLDGYPINTVAPMAPGNDNSLLGYYINYNDNHWNGSITVFRNHLIIDALIMTLNVSFRLYLTNSGHPVDNAEYIAKYLSANLLLYNYYLDIRKSAKDSISVQSYPLAWYENGIVTYNRGYQTLGEKIWNFYGIWTILFTIFVLMVTFAVIRLSESRKTAFTVFEIIRLLISQSLQARMNTLPIRIFFVTILIYFLIVQATFNGHLAKFLTKPELRRHPETHEDLEDLGYTVYYSNHADKYFGNKKALHTSYSAKIKGCLNYILYNDSSVACIFNHFYLEYLQSLKTRNLYISKRSTESLYSTFFIRKHWPLLNRVNMVIILLEEMGLRQLSSNQERYNITHNSTVAEARSNKDFHPIKLENLMFSFWILAVGLVSAAFSFCVEMFLSLKWNLISEVKNI